MSGYTGLIKKFPVDRELTGQDRKYRLDQNERLELIPYPDLAVIRLNSTYLEVVDKYFQGKGFLSLMVLAFSAIFIAGGWQFSQSWRKRLGR